MTTTPNHCPKCKGSMEQGFVTDNTYGAVAVSQWVAGAPQKSFWTGTKVPKRACVPIGGYRCASCGYLEFYARTEFVAQ